MDTLEELTECCELEDDPDMVMPFITAIRVQFGPRESARVFKAWCVKRNIPTDRR